LTRNDWSTKESKTRHNQITKMETTQPVAAAAPPAPPADASPAPVAKTRRVERRERLRKSALCKHFDKPGGCPFPNCRFAHGRCVRCYPHAAHNAFRVLTK
jgi:hypothetical protein